VPRWFTEGLAEYETIIARPEWRREEDHNLYRAISTGTLPPLRQMNQAFTHARSAQDMMNAYYASSQIVKYIAEQHGFDDLVAMLRAWGTGQQTPDVIQSALGVGIDQLDRDFRAHTLQRLAARGRDFGVDFGRYRDVRALTEAAQQRPDDADAQAAMAAGLLTSGQADEARQAASRAIARDQAHPLARYILAMLATISGEGAEAEQHLRAILAGGKDGYDIRIMLARAAAARDDQPGMRRELEAAVALDPDRSEAWQGLLAVAENQNDDALRARALERVAMIDQHDRGAWVAFITLLAEQQKWRELAAAAESAQFVAPENSEVHRLLGQARLEIGQAEPALRAFDLALLASPESPAPIHLGRARALAALNRRPEARRAADEAVRLDPSLAEAARGVR
jgi:tetratricopeptide (TPR) repeat protein